MIGALSSVSSLWPLLFVVSAKAAAFYVAAAVAALLSRKRSAAARHRLWAAASLGGLLVPLAAALVPAVSRALHVDAGVSVPVLPGALALALVRPGIAGSAGGVAADSAGAAWTLALASAWAAGGVIMLVRLARGHLAARAWVRSSRPASSSSSSSSSPLLAAHAAAARALGRSPRVDVRESNEVRAPVTVGVLRATILLPAQPMGDDELRAVLVHELAHVMRRDNAAQLVAGVARALYWWNPLAWYAARRLRVERELACDDVVLASGAAHPSAYAGLLVDLARRMGDASSSSSSAAACAVETAGVSARVEHILRATPRALVPAAAARAGAVLVWASASAGLALAGLHAPRASSAERPLEDLVRAALDDPGACFTQSGADADAPPSFIVHWLVDDEGRVAESCITRDELKDDAARACVMRRLESARFDDELRGASLEVAFTPVLRARLMSGSDVFTPDGNDIPDVPFLLARPRR